MPLPRVRPYDVTSLDDSTVAISTWEKNVIHVVDINSGTITECIRGNFCGGITRRGNTLVCCLRSNEIKTVDLRTNTVSPLISNVAIHPETYVTTSANKLFVTHRSNNTVTCYNMNGDNEWQYFDPSKVTSPLGVTVDRYNNVYVSCFGHNSVVLISPDGKQARTILDARDGLFDPYCVNFQNQTNLLGTSYTGDAFLYNIS
ncbi:unnamed protein product [Mytilus edulis]|uniref:Uncharacterized protein n=1 Tax=Mytilus edulis TaxID=6550 RepID=A0A8S3QQJ6_MYTED|nr:unnamed protein product [Mytilus edulis]